MSSEGEWSSGEEGQNFSIREIQARRRNAVLAGKDRKQRAQEEGQSTATSSGSKAKAEKHVPIGQRKKSNKPMEFSNRMPNAGTRKAVKSRHAEVRDPRFSDLHGTFDAQGFADAYSFIDEMRANEKAQLKKTVSKGKRAEKSGAKHHYAKRSVAEAERASQLLTKINSIDTQRQRKQDIVDAKRTLKKEAAAKQKELGSSKKYYIKNSAAKRLVMEDKFKKLEKDGMVEKTMAKLSKRQATKERKFLPRSRLAEE